MSLQTCACKVAALYHKAVGILECGFNPVLLLVFRIWAGWVFFRAGQLKIANWDSTLYLFEYEYQVPLLPFELAAYVGTAVELLLPPLLILGLLGRPVALVLFLFNIMAVVSYPLLWEQGFYDHQFWGMMLLVVVMYGPGKLSLDHWLCARMHGCKKPGL